MRESFAAKIMVALLGTVGALLLVTYVVVRSVTTEQVRVAVERAVGSAATQFEALEAIQRAQIARLAYPLTETPRALAALEAAIMGGQLDTLALDVDYEVDLVGIDDILVVITDSDGEPLLTLHNRERMIGVDPVGVRPVAEELLAGTDYEARAYRAFEGNFYPVQTRVIESRVLLGTVSFALPIEDDDMRRIGAVAGAEVCFVLDGVCVAGTPLAGDSLAATLVRAVETGGEVRAEIAGRPWSIQAEALLPDDPEEGWRVVAVPLDAVLAPFNRITNALLLGGLGALVLALMAGVVLIRGLTRPVRALVEATGRVAGGDYDVEVSVGVTDEIGTLAGAFNDMTRGLALKERYRSVLNKVVSREVAEQLMDGGVELGGENRRVTVLFADIRGFTSLTDGMEPQRVIGLLNECMQRLSDAVEAEMGVVDKFVGDELMAVFGAPVALPDDALRAVRAAVRMRAAVEELNEVRAARDERPIGLGVGLNTGEAVAGNMGSANRLNYTVLGDVVNLGARLCSGAAPGEILVTGHVLADAGPDVRARPLGDRAFKGFTSEVEVFAVEDVQMPAHTRPNGSPVTATPVAAIMMAAALVLSAPAAGQEGWPTLADAGLQFMSESGAFQLDFSGRLDLEAFALSGTDSGLLEGDGTWFAPRVRLFADVFMGDHVYGLFELRGDRGPGPSESDAEVRLDQAFLRLATASGGFGVQVGRFASPFGTYAQRHLTEQDPFIRPPLPYDQRTSLAYYDVPSGIPRFMEWHNDEMIRGMGSPPVWGVPYQWGAMLSGFRGRLTYRVAVMNSAPSSEPELWNWDKELAENPSMVVGLGATLTPSLSMGVSWNRGPYLQDTVQAKLDLIEMDKSRFTYEQEIFSVDATWARGPAVIRAEAFLDQWDVPNVDNVKPTELAYTVEAQTDLSAGFYAAVRWGMIDYRPLEGAGVGGGADPDWDYDVQRWEASLGYRFARNAGLLVSGGITNRTGPREADADLVAVRMWWAF